MVTRPTDTIAKEYLRNYEANVAIIESITNVAARLYQTVLDNKALGAQARRWLRLRGIGEKMVRKWEIGASPAQNNWLLSQLSEVYHTDVLRESGLFIRNLDTGELKSDRFHRRVTFPVRDASGLAVSMTARAADNVTHPKYVGMPNTAIFEKQSALYGIHVAVSDIINKGRALIVEGQLDAITLHQFGFCNTVALMGTSLCEAHIDALSRWCDTITFMADGDDAGLTALNRAHKLRFEQDLGVKLILVRVPPKEGDPDSFVRRQGARVFAESLKRWEAAGV